MSSNTTLQDVDLHVLEPLLTDPEVTEIMVNGLENVYIAKRGQMIETDVRFSSEDEIVTLIQSICGAMGREISARAPMVDVRLPDGSRAHAVLRPVAINGPVLTLRKFMEFGLTWDRLVGYGSVSQEIVDFLRACVQARINLVVAGGPAAGKTTIMNAISEFIPSDERVVTVEMTNYLNLRHKHVVALEARRADPDGQGGITMTDLITNAQLMRPDRIISGEVVGSEAWDMLQVMSLGYDGSMFSIHATSVQDMLDRLEIMSTIAAGLPLLHVRAKIVQGVRLVVQQLRLADGTRKVVSITEIVGLNNGVIETQDICRFEPTGEADGRIQGEFRWTGHVPRFAHVLGLPADFFTR